MRPHRRGWPTRSSTRCSPTVSPTRAPNGPGRDWASVRGWDDPVSLDGRVAVTQVYGGDLAGPRVAPRPSRLAGRPWAVPHPVLPGPVQPPLQRRQLRPRRSVPRWRRRPDFAGQGRATTGASRSSATSPSTTPAIITSGSGPRRPTRRRPRPGSTSSAHHPDDYEAWFDIPTLPKFDLRDAELQRRLLSGADSVTASWLRPPFDLDGWRVDVANMAGRLRDIDANHDAAVAMRRAMAGARPDAYLVGEHGYDATGELDGDGWHGVMNYLVFTRPVWCWLRGDDDHVEVPRRPAPRAALRRRRHRGRDARGRRPAQPWRQMVAGFDLLGSHDTTRFRTVCGSTERQMAGPGCCSRCRRCRWCSPATSWGSRASMATGPVSRCRGTRVAWDHEVLDGYRAPGRTAQQLRGAAARRAALGARRRRRPRVPARVARRATARAGEPR